MKKLLKGSIIFAVLTAVIGISFYLYSRFLVDYSLENLELALSVTKQDPARQTPLDRREFRNVVQDLSLQEASQEKTDYRNLALLELASRSMDEAVDRKGYERAKIYLDQVKKSKLSQRNLFLQFTDFLYAKLRFYLGSFSAFFRHLRAKLFPGVRLMNQPEDYSGLLLLNRAEESERNRDLARAEKFYRSYLELYPDRSDRGIISISMAHVLMREKKYEEAQKILEEIQKSFGGLRESELASNLLRKIWIFHQRENIISQLKGTLASQGALDELSRFKLAMAYLSSYQLDEARDLLKQLQSTQDPEVRRRVNFYYAWISKVMSDYDLSARLFLKLLEDKNLEKDFELAVQAQIADVYYQKGDAKKSLNQYETILTEAEKGRRQAERFQDTWISLAEIEKANLYYFEMGDAAKGRDSLAQLNQAHFDPATIRSIAKGLQEASQQNLRELAFNALLNKKVHDALELFKRNLRLHPDDAWTLSGLGTAYLLLGDIEQAADDAKKGYTSKVDEYTASVLAYVYGVSGRYQESAVLYDEALGRNHFYVPALFNRGCLHLRNGEYDQALKLLNQLYRRHRKIPKLVRAKVLNNMGYALWYAGDPELAIKRLHNAVELMPDYAVALDNLKKTESEKLVSHPTSL